MAQYATCTVEDCIFPTTHHHLMELDGKATACKGETDAYDRPHTCCQLGDLYAPKVLWRDRQGDVWTLEPDGLMHTVETAPFPREFVEKKWGPLTKI